MTDSEDSRAGAKGQSWYEYRLMVVEQLHTLNDHYKSLSQRIGELNANVGERQDHIETSIEAMGGAIAELNKKLAVLEVKAGLWGAVASVFVSAIGFLLLMISRMKP